MMAPMPSAIEVERAERLLELMAFVARVFHEPGERLPFPQIRHSYPFFERRRLLRTPYAK